MSEEQPGTPDDWDSVEEGPDGDSSPGSAGADRRADGDEGSGQGDPRERRRRLDERERELERREQEVLDRREETVERAETLDEREQRLEERKRQLNDRTQELDEREADLDEREREIEAKREGLQEYLDEGGADAFTDKPRVTAAWLLGVTAVAAGLLAVGTVTYAAAPDPPLLGAALVEPGTARVVGGLLGVAALIELVGAASTYTGWSWAVSVVAAVVAIVVLPPVGLAATVMLTVGEAGFE